MGRKERNHLCIEYYSNCIVFRTFWNLIHLNSLAHLLLILPSYHYHSIELNVMKHMQGRGREVLYLTNAACLAIIVVRDPVLNAFEVPPANRASASTCLQQSLPLTLSFMAQGTDSLIHSSSSSSSCYSCIILLLLFRCWDYGRVTAAGVMLLQYEILKSKTEKRILEQNHDEDVIDEDDSICAEDWNGLASC